MRVGLVDDFASLHLSGGVCLLLDTVRMQAAKKQRAPNLPPETATETLAESNSNKSSRAGLVRRDGLKCEFVMRVREKNNIRR